MEKSRHISFEVKPQFLEQAKNLVTYFVLSVRAHEPGTVLYSSFQDADNPCVFTHIMIFKNEEVQQVHRNSNYVMDFTKGLYPICLREPNFKDVIHFLSN